MIVAIEQEQGKMGRLLDFDITLDRSARLEAVSSSALRDERGLTKIFVIESSLYGKGIEQRIGIRTTARIEKTPTMHLEDDMFSQKKLVYCSRV